MRVLVATRKDSASVNIRDRLVEAGGWEDSGRTFRGGPVLARSEAILVEVEGPVITDERLSQDLAALGLPIMDVWFLSRHRAQSGQASLTVHPIGNHGEAALGGRPETLSSAAARDMGALLRRLRVRRDEAGLPHEVTYEATHHGPLMEFPSLFVEIGSDDTWYRDRGSAEAVAAAIEDVLGGEGRCAGPVLVGVGGGHYVPRMTGLALSGAADFGHLVPAYALGEGDADSVAQGAGRAVLERAVAATPGSAGVYVHKKGLKGPQRQAVRTWLEELGLPSVDL